MSEHTFHSKCTARSTFWKLYIFFLFVLDFFVWLRMYYPTHTVFMQLTPPQQLRRGNAAKTIFIFGGSRLHFKDSLVVFSAIWFEYRCSQIWLWTHMQKYPGRCVICMQCWPALFWPRSISTGACVLTLNPLINIKFFGHATFGVDSLFLELYIKSTSIVIPPCECLPHRTKSNTCWGLRWQAAT